jgi:hypothetical protein
MIVFAGRPSTSPGPKRNGKQRARFGRAGGPLHRHRADRAELDLGPRPVVVRLRDASDDEVGALRVEVLQHQVGIEPSDDVHEPVIVEHTAAAERGFHRLGHRAHLVALRAGERERHAEAGRPRARRGVHRSGGGKPVVLELLAQLDLLHVGGGAERDGKV